MGDKYQAFNFDGILCYDDEDKATVQQNAVDDLALVGGTLHLIENEMDESVIVPANVYVIQDYQGTHLENGVNFNELITLTGSLLHVQIFPLVIPENEGHAQLTHNLGVVPSTVVLGPVDDVGRCWYDMNTISETTVDIYVANPPLIGGYLVNVVLYYV
jgi:hypothetical protein